ncbi:prohibitin family protein [Kallotenue papyrolyticum]|uniref:prohibitin family protein n=1 Tax=Kallotenue papyrolyticum TaxID=1325125 RepID=UPI0009DED7A5|nr:prohibitin family protein [Kallotenue papyrolyticum]
MTTNSDARPGRARSAARRLAGTFTLGVAALIAVLAFMLIFAAWRTIEPGYVGIVFDKVSRRVSARALDPGWQFINPFTQSIQQYPVTIQTYSMVQRSGEGSAETDDSIKVQSSEGQQVNLDVVIQYQVIKEEAGELFQDWGGAPISVVEERVVRQYTRSQVPLVASRYGWEEITSSKREQITNEVAARLSEEFRRRHLRLISFGIREVHLPQQLQQALDQKIQAQQQAERQRYELEQAQVRAQQDKVTAEGQANARRAQAQGEADAIRIQAEAQAQANRLLAESLTPEVIRYLQMQKWDGKLPVFNGGNATPLIDATEIISSTVGAR